MKKLLIVVIALILLDPVFDRYWSWSSYFDQYLKRTEQITWNIPPLDKIATNNRNIEIPLPHLTTAKVTKSEIAAVERQVVELINRDRAAAGLSPVSWDETAAQAAQKHVQEEADNGYISHWGMDGVKPQERYSQAGGLDAVEENESVSLWTGGGFQGISQEDLLKTVTEHEQAMVTEQPPDDGHRKNILDRHHTGVGIAIAVGKYGVAMAQEFTNNYAKLVPPPFNASPGEKVAFSGQIMKGYQITGIYAIWEDLPQPKNKAELMQTHSYSDPPFANLHFWAKPHGTGYYMTTATGNVFAHNLSVDKKGNFSLQIPLINRPALDYINLEIAPESNLQDHFYAGQYVVRIR